jgi:hypothetical protein
MRSLIHSSLIPFLDFSKSFVSKSDIKIMIMLLIYWILSVVLINVLYNKIDTVELYNTYVCKKDYDEEIAIVSDEILNIFANMNQNVSLAATLA